MEEKTYKNSPIVEAVIHIGFSLRKDYSNEIHQELFKGLQEQFSERKTISETSLRLSNTMEQSSTSQNMAVGSLFISADNKNILRVDDQGIALSRLKPYHSWHALKSRFRSICDVVETIFGDIVLNRVALRYINEFECGLFELSKYLRILPTMANIEEYALSLNAINQRFSLYNSDLDANAIIGVNTWAQKKNEHNSLKINFDIDVFKKKKYNLSENALFNDLEALRGFKNLLFEKNLTDQAKRDFE